MAQILTQHGEVTRFVIFEAAARTVGKRIGLYFLGILLVTLIQWYALLFALIAVFDLLGHGRESAWEAASTKAGMWRLWNIALKVRQERYAI